MERISRAIGTLPEDATMESAARCFTQVLRNDMPEAALTCAALRPTCSAVVYSRMRREVWLFGDCQCRFEGKTYDNPKHVDEILTRARCEAVAYLLSKGASADSIRHFDAGRAFIYDALRDQTNFQNDPDVRNPYRYTVKWIFPPCQCWPCLRRSRNSSWLQTDTPFCATHGAKQKTNSNACCAKTRFASMRMRPRNA